VERCRLGESNSMLANPAIFPATRSLRIFPVQEIARKPRVRGNQSESGPTETNPTITTRQ